MGRKPVPYRAPDQLNQLDVADPPQTAAGTEAVWISAQTVRKAAGTVRGGKALLKLNQKGGVDCPGCAWPDPMGLRPLPKKLLKRGLEQNFSNKTAFNG